MHHPQAQNARDIDSGKKELQKGEMSETVFAKKGKKPDGSFLNLPQPNLESHLYPWVGGTYLP